ncbi:MAG: hypothetical protein ACON39_05240 [Coraliomargaritaceae bacterium]
MTINIPVLLTAGSGLLAIAATSFSSNSAPKLPLRITHDAANRAVDLGFKAQETDQYYLIEGSTELTQGSWTLNYGVKGDGDNKSQRMPTIANKCFYRLLRVGADDPLLGNDYDGDKIIMLDELDRGLDAFELVPDDRDADGIPSDWEAVYGLDANDPGDARMDPDGDRHSNLDEYRSNTDSQDVESHPPEPEFSEQTTHCILRTVQEETDSSTSRPRGNSTHKEALRTEFIFDHPSNRPYSILEYSSESTFPNIPRYNRSSQWVERLNYWGYEDLYHILRTLDRRVVTYEDRTEEYKEIKSGSYSIESFSGPPLTFLIEHKKHSLIEEERVCVEPVHRWQDSYCIDHTHTELADPAVLHYELVHWDGRQLTIDGEPVSLPTGERSCKFAYGQVELPFRVDLDIVHPATGILAEGREDKDHDSHGGYVALKREVGGEDLAPVTQLKMDVSSLFGSYKFRLKFNSGGRYRIYKDADRTEEVVSEQTEFPADKDTTVYLQGLKKSDDLGGETVTLQVGLDEHWIDTDSVDFTVVQSEFEIVHRVFIPYNWVDIPLHPFHPQQVAEGDDRGFDPGLTGTYRVEQRAVLCPYRDLDASPVKDNEKRAGITRHFDESNVSNHSGALHSGLEPQQPSRIQKDSVPVNTGIASLGNVRAYLLASPVDHQTHLRMEGSAAEPIVMGAGLVAPIDWLFDIAIGVGNPAEPQVILSGEHDGFPAYEIYVYAGRDKSSPTTVLQWLPPIESGVLALAGNDPDTPVEERTKPIEQ